MALNWLARSGIDLCGLLSEFQLTYSVPYFPFSHTAAVNLGTGHGVRLVLLPFFLCHSVQASLQPELGFQLTPNKPLFGNSFIGSACS